MKVEHLDQILHHNPFEKAQGAQHGQHVGLLSHDAARVVGTFNLGCCKVIHTKQTHEASKTGTRETFRPNVSWVARACHCRQFDLT